MSEMTRLCRFIGKDPRLDNNKTYMVKITEEEKITYEKELLSVNMFGKRTFTTKQVKKYSVVATTQNRIMVYSDLDRFLENWKIIG